MNDESVYPLLGGAAVSYTIRVIKGVGLISKPRQTPSSDGMER